MEGLRNMMEDTVEQKLSELLPTYNYCQCDECKIEMATYALNRIQPNYTHTKAGEILHQFNTSIGQADAEIISTVIKAIETIGEKPRHKTPPTDS